ncbi:hypothetical protein AO916_22335 [Pseudomonas aeruginosa]|nr:hypothetical protein AO916_22335 [Pseudomonas aeruginosa]
MGDQIWLESLLWDLLCHPFEIPPAAFVFAVRPDTRHRWQLQAELVADDFFSVQVQQAFALDEAAFLVRVVGEVMLTD